MKKNLASSIVVVLLLSLAVASMAQAPAVQNVDVHGFIQSRLQANPESGTRFYAYRIDLNLAAKLADGKSAYVEWYYHPWSTGSQTYLESAFMDVPLTDGKLRIGKGRMLNFGIVPTVPNRKMTQYSPLAELFTQDRIQGIQYTFQKENTDGGITLYTDNRIKSRLIGDTPGLEMNPTVDHFVEKDDATVSGRMAVAARYGWSDQDVKVHVSAAVGSLTPTDTDYIATGFGVAPTTDETHNKYGIDVQYSKNGIVASGEYYTGRFSFATLSGYSLLLGYEPKEKEKAKFYARYTAMDNDQTIKPANKFSWPTKQIMLGIVQPISNKVWVELEYENNTESTGGAASVKNDVLFAEFFTGF